MVYVWRYRCIPVEYHTPIMIGTQMGYVCPYVLLMSQANLFIRDFYPLAVFTEPGLYVLYIHTNA